METKNTPGAAVPLSRPAACNRCPTGQLSRQIQELIRNIPASDTIPVPSLVIIMAEQKGSSEPVMHMVWRQKSPAQSEQPTHAGT